MYDFCVDSAEAIVNLDNVKSITQYPYRTARVSNVFINIEKYEGETMDGSKNTIGMVLSEMTNIQYTGAYRNELYTRVEGVKPDNHVTFEIEYADGHKMAVMCSDGHCYIGTGIKIASW